MPPFFSKPPPIPRPQTLFIYSLFTLNKSLKNYPKHFKCFKVETKVSRSGDPPILPKSRLKALQRRARSLKVLNLEKHYHFFKLNSDQALTLIKSFNHISSLSLFGSMYIYYSNKSSLKWFTQSKELSHLTFGTLSMSSSSHFPSFSLFKAIQANYQKTLKRSKLVSIHIQSPEALLFQSEFYPSTLHKLSISLVDPLSKFYPLNLPHYFHIHHLSTLHLKFPLLLQHLLEILNSLPNPHKIAHLTTSISDDFASDDSSAEKLSKAFTHFQSLYSLTLEINCFLCISTLQKFFKTPLNLRELSLCMPIQKQRELIELGELIENLKNLSLLAIANSKSIQGYASKGHRIFFTKISELTQLKSLRIHLCGEDVDPSKKQLFYGCLGEFAGCLKTMHELQEIKFVQSEIAIAPEFDSLADALKEKSSRLKKLKIKFLNGEKEIDHLKKLNKAFKTMESLEELSLENLCTQKESLAQFGKVVSELKGLRLVKLDGKNPCLENADLVKTIKKILTKYGLEELKWFGDKPIDEMYNFAKVMDPIDIKEVISRNARLYSVCMDYYGEKKRGLDFKNVKGFLP